MPCNSDMGSSGDIAMSLAGRAMKKADEVTDMLCSLLRSMTPEQLIALDPKLQVWFAEHLKHDAKQGR